MSTPSARKAGHLGPSDGRQLVESQERLLGIIASATDAIITVEAEQRITLFNAAAEQMFRCPASEAIGSPLDRFIPERFRVAHRAHIEPSGSPASLLGPWAIRVR